MSRTGRYGLGLRGRFQLRQQSLVPRLWVEADELRERAHPVTAIRQSDATDAVVHSQRLAAAVSIWLGEDGTA
jgi:hypothetical protein